MKTILLYFATLMTLLTFVACGGGGGGGSSNTPAATTPTTQTTTATFKVSLTGTLPANTAIAGAAITLTLPANVIPAITNGAVAAGVVTPSGTFAGGTQSAVYTAATASTPGKLKIDLANTSATGITQVGEVATVILQLTNGATSATGTSVSATAVYNVSVAPIAGMSATVAGQTYSVSGTVTSNSTGLAGVTVTTTGATATTNASGSYTLSGLAAGSYTLTPSLAGYTFSPATRTTAVSNASVTAQNFAATAASVTPPPSTNACIPYKVGNSMTYSSSVGSSVGTITAVSGSDITTQSSFGTMTISMSSTVTGCNLSSSVSQITSSGSYSSANSWSPPLPTMPSSFATGYTETVSSTLTSSSTIVSCSGPQTTTFTVIGPESITVAAGTFSAIKIQSATTINQTCTKGSGAGGSTDTLWVVPGIGIVKTQAATGETSQLASYTFN
jgi:hypothetical protein